MAVLGLPENVRLIDEYQVRSNFLRDGHNDRGTVNMISKELGDIDIAICVPHRNVDLYFDSMLNVRDNEFLINVWSGAHSQHYDAPSASYPTVTDAWGYRIPCEDEPFRTLDQLQDRTWINEVGAYKEIVSPEGAVMGVLYARRNGSKFNTLSLYWDLTHYGNEAEYVILQHIMKEVAIELGITPLEDGERELNRLIYITEKYVKEKLATKERDWRKANDKTEELTQLLSESIRRAQILGAELKGLDESLGNIKTKMESSLRELSTQYGVVKVAPASSLNGVSVYTHDIYIETEEYGTHYIGKFRIDIPFEIGIKPIRLININNPRDAFWSGDASNHPHVNGNGNPCWGNVASTVAMLHGELELVPLVNVIISYLESVNMDDVAGASIWAWGDSIDSPGYQEIVIGDCQWCGEEVRHGEATMYEGMIFCNDDCRERWIDENYETCPDCGDAFNIDDGYYDDELDTYFCCYDCRDNYVSENYYVCPACESLIPNDDAHMYTAEGEYGTEHYCSSSCRSELATQCAQCGEWVTDDWAIAIDGVYDRVFCSDECVDEFKSENMVECAECGELIEIDDAVEGILEPDNRYCDEDCRDNHEEDLRNDADNDRYEGDGE